MHQPGDPEAVRGVGSEITRVQFVLCTWGTKDSAPFVLSPLKLHQDSHVDERFVLAQVGEPHAAKAATACGFGRGETGLARRRAIAAGKKLRRAIVASRRSNAATTGPVRHVGMAIVVLPTEGDVLLRHIVE